jgi:hypothetical protein
MMATILGISFLKHDDKTILYILSCLKMNFFASFTVFIGKRLKCGTSFWLTLYLTIKVTSVGTVPFGSQLPESKVL